MPNNTLLTLSNLDAYDLNLKSSYLPSILEQIEAKNTEQDAVIATKLDKSGGTITGNLIVEGKTDTALGAIVSKQNGIAYGLAYDGYAYKLGEGTINSESGEFTFNSGEGLPIALRDDNSTFTDGNLVKWSKDGNKLIDSNISSNNIATKEWVQANIISSTIDQEFFNLLY